jgi:hypothetical protein
VLGCSTVGLPKYHLPSDDELLAAVVRIHAMRITPVVDCVGTLDRSACCLRCLPHGERGVSIPSISEWSRHIARVSKPWKEINERYLIASKWILCLWCCISRGWLFWVLLCLSPFPFKLLVIIGTFRRFRTSNYQISSLRR